jgi:uncharacterized protein (TIGR02466 family)
MNLDHWFPSVVGRSFHPEWIDPMNSAFDNFFAQENDNLNTKFYYNGRTTYGTRNLYYDPEFAEFGKFIQAKGREFLDMMGYDSDAVNWRPYLFANSFKEGSAHPKHAHSQCSISGIYYLKTPPGSSPIVFYPNQPFKDFFDYMYAVKDPTNWYSLQETQYQPYPGLLLMWPSWLYHEVKPNGSTEPRTSLVFNL